LRGGHQATFGELVRRRGDFTSSGVLFAVITLVQFLVVAKGAGG
jgi:type III secretory pathway component EscV